MENEFVSKQPCAKTGWCKSGFLQKVLGVKESLCKSKLV